MRSRLVHATSALGWTFTEYGPEYTSFEDGRLTGGFHQGGTPGGGVLVVIFAVDLGDVETRVRSGNELAVWSDR